MSKVSPEESQPIDTLRLTETAARAMSDALDRQDSIGPNAKKGHLGPPHYPVFRSVVMELHRPGTTAARYLVMQRSVGSESMSLFHGFFLNAGTACFVTLRTRDHESVQVAGVVRSCRLVQGRVHEVELAFNQPVDPSHFAAVPGATGDSAGPAANRSAQGGETSKEYTSDDIVRAAEQLLQIARRGGTPEDRRMIEDELRRLLSQSAAA